MKALTIWQPWASLLVSGQKKYETRSWATAYRGPIAIHAAMRPVRRAGRRQGRERVECAGAAGRPLHPARGA